MLKSVLLVSLCLVLVSGSKPTHLQKNSPLSSSLSSCDIQSVKKLVGEVVTLTSDTASTVVENVVKIIPSLAFCLWPFDLYMCLESDMEFDIYDSLKDIVSSLENYNEQLTPLLKEISNEINACA